MQGVSQSKYTTYCMSDFQKVVNQRSQEYTSVADGPKLRDKKRAPARSVVFGDINSKNGYHLYVQDIKNNLIHMDTFYNEGGYPKLRRYNGTNTW